MTDTLGDTGPTFSTLGGAVQQPGTIHADHMTHSPDIQHEKPQKTLHADTMASDKFAIPGTVVDNKRAYQLLPVDPHRKRALIYCITSPIFIGDQPGVDAIAGSGLAALTGAPGIFFIPAATWPPFEYTSKASLWVLCAAAGNAVAQVACMVERYDSGTPVT